MFKNASLNWKTEEAAEFSTIITIKPGQVFRGTIIIRKDQEGWKIVSL